MDYSKFVMKITKNTNFNRMFIVCDSKYRTMVSMNSYRWFAFKPGEELTIYNRMIIYTNMLCTLNYVSDNVEKNLPFDKWGKK